MAADTSPAAAPSLCSNTAGAPACKGSVKDLKAARQAFARGLKLEKSQHENLQSLDEAFYEFEEASRLVPQNVEYLTAREMTRQHLAGLHLQRGNSDLLNGRQVEALAEFRTALNLDPQNEFAQQRISDALGPVPVRTASPPQMVASADVLTAKPANDRHDIHYRGDSRGLLTAVAASYGLTVVFDDNFPSRRVRFDIDGADFGAALRQASSVTKSFSVALEDGVLFTCAETPENHRLYDRMGLRSFYISGGNPQDLNELMNTLRTLFEFRFASLNAASSTITLRGPQAALEAATQFLGQLNAVRPEVMLDLKVFQVSHTYMRNIGLHVPNQFHLFNIPVSALAALGGQNIQNLINQLIASGGINQANSTSLSALLAQLGSQQSSVFSQPLATFGGGLTLMGLSLDQLAFQLSVNESWAQSLDHLTLRTGQGNEANFHLGTRYPIVNATYAPIFNSSAISKVLGNQSYIPPVPSVSYEDLGLNLKAKPTVHGNGDVSIQLNLQVRALTGSTRNGQPIISNREYQGSINLKDGEPAAVAGQVSLTEQRSLSGIPGLGQIPGLNQVMVSNSKSEQDDELLIVITPHVLSNTTRSTEEIWITAK